jgi:uncharacterized protein YbjT (DUF2867 family)
MYAITAATGHTGNIVARRLLEQGKDVRVIGRDKQRLQPLVELGAEPFIGEPTDSAALLKAFKGATAAYIVVPPDMASNDYRAFQDRVTEATATALASAGVRSAVTLSSVGADKPDKTGPVAGLFKLEQRLNAISGLNVLHLRCGYFMENTLAQAGIIRAMGSAAGPVRPSLKIPMIASADIGERAAHELLNLQFRGQTTQELLGQRDINMTEAAAIIGKAIGKPGLSYLQISDDQFRSALGQAGISANMANLILEMVAAMNSGHMRALEPRSPKNSTPTTFESFVAETLVPLYEGTLAHA